MFEMSYEYLSKSPAQKRERLRKPRKKFSARRLQAAGPTIGTFLNSFQVTILPNLGSPMWVSLAASSPGAAGLVPQPYSFRSTSPGSAS
jgi:hypothetical protein